MKKVLIAAFAAFLVAGLVYVGYLIFSAMNVKHIEIVGDMQQVYFVGDDINFAGAQLKVTYHNGDIKMVDLSENTVKVSLFSTSGHGKYFGTMKLTYKSETIEVDYQVLDRTSYIIANETKKTNSQTLNINSSTKRIIDFKENGVLRYFEIKNGKYYMNDGELDNRYNYKIVGNTIIATLNDKSYEIKPVVNGNELEIKAKSYYYSSTNAEIPSYIIETEFETTNLIKTNNFKEEKTMLSLDYSNRKFSVQNLNGNYPVVIINDGDTIDNSGVCLKVNYDNGEIYYVYITESMLTKNITSNYGNESFHVDGYYDGRRFILVYKFN